MTSWDRRAVFASTAAAALLGAAGLSSAGALPQRGGRMRAALPGAARTDRWGGTGLFMQAVEGAVFERLTEIAADGTLRARLAAGWRSDAAGLIWRFELREDAFFHDGTALEVGHVIAALASHRHRLNIAELDALGPHQLMITLSHGDANLPYALAHPHMVIADPARRDAGIGTGLYRVKDFQPGTRFLGERVAEHYRDGQSGWFDRVDFAAISDPVVRGQALSEGLVDVAHDVPPARFLRRIETTALSAEIGTSDMTGKAHPLDNLAFAERWWRL